MSSINVNREFAKLTQRQQLEAVHGAVIQLMAAVDRLSAEMKAHEIRMDDLHQDVIAAKNRSR